LAKVVPELNKEVKIDLPYYVPGQPPYSFPWQTDIDYMDTLKTLWGEEWGAQGIGKLRRALVAFADESEACEEFAADPVYFGRLAGQPDISKCQASLYWEYLEFGRWGERRMSGWEWVAARGRMYQALAGIT